MPVLQRSASPGDKQSLVQSNVLLVDRLHKLPYDERHTLNALDLFLRSHKLPFQTPLLILNVLFLEVNVSGNCQSYSGSCCDTGLLLQLPLELLKG